MENNYQTLYNNRWALIIGVNEYKYVNSLEYAKNDAEAVANLLINKFQIPAKNVTKLFDVEATKEAILSNYMQFSKEHIDKNDQLLVFFAGHGHTISGNRKEVGFLIPSDGTLDDVSTLIRWDELTRNAELIKAKHILFIMDACFSGLAITRALPQGSARYLINMLNRYSRQVLTAGKANEPVSDGDGPIPKHSIFTGYLLKALNGDLDGAEGIISANSVMAYVANKVANDPYSNQSPHYGYFEGDGDFIFNVPPQTDLIENDILLEIPILPSRDTKDKTEYQLLEDVKGHLASEHGRIYLDTITIQELRRYFASTSTEYFPMQTGSISYEDISKRLKQYESLSLELQIISIAISHWGDVVHNSILKKIVSRLTDHIESNNGNTIWLDMQWYPIYTLMYVLTIAAIESERYAVIAEILTMPVIDKRQNNKTFIEATVKHMMELDRSDIFKNALDNRNYYAPRSEYMFRILQPILDDILFLGKSYEYLFDKADALIAMIYYDITMDTSYSGWMPPGRFAWKFGHSLSGNVITDIIRDAELKKAEWGPLKQGLFSGSYDRFLKVAEGTQAFIRKLNWI